jgi:hypothetical protein
MAIRKPRTNQHTITRLKVETLVVLRFCSRMIRGRVCDPEKLAPDSSSQPPSYDPTPEEIAWLNTQLTDQGRGEQERSRRQVDRRRNRVMTELHCESEFPGIMPPAFAEYLAYGNVHE